MKVMIDIPKEFEEDLKDNFQEFFNRIVADITYSLNDEEPMCCGNYERETAEMFLSAFGKSTVIPDDATKYVNDEEVSEENREIMEQMLDVEPVFREIGTESEKKQ